MRSQIIFAVGLVVVAAACSSAPSSGACRPRVGTYLATFSSRSGNCGKIPEQVYVFDGDAGAPEGCTESGNPSATACEVTLDTTCKPGPNEPDKLATTVRGKATWSEDANTATAVLQFILKHPDGSTECEGTYDVSFRRQ